MKIVAIGGTGLIGSKLVKKLREHGREVVAASPTSDVILLSAAILAGYGPARRASRIDPLAALRQE